MQFLIGTDPEIFLKNKTTGEFVAPSMYGFEGTKKEPVKVDKGAYQVDGLALEFNTDPAENCEQFLTNVFSMLDFLKQLVKEKTNDEAEICITPIANFNEEYFAQIDEQSKILGCDPDYNINGAMNMMPEYLANAPIRTAAGHIHIGWGQDFDVNASDHFHDCLTVASKFYADNVFPVETPEEQERMKFYGGDGSFRPKTYGVELRSPSNLWLTSPAKAQEVYEKTIKVMESF